MKNIYNFFYWLFASKNQKEINKTKDKIKKDEIVEAILQNHQELRFEHIFKQFKSLYKSLYLNIEFDLMDSYLEYQKEQNRILNLHIEANKKGIQLKINDDELFKREKNLMENRQKLEHLYVSDTKCENLLHSEKMVYKTFPKIDISSKRFQSIDTQIPHHGLWWDFLKPNKNDKYICYLCTVDAIRMLSKSHKESYLREVGYYLRAGAN